MIYNITVLVDNDSWILPYAEKLVRDLINLKKNAVLARSHENVVDGDICFFFRVFKNSRS